MKKQGNSIAGRKKNTDYDFYETPQWATEKAVEQMIIDGILSKYDEIYEPCCGAGAMTKVLEIYFKNVKKSDIQTADYIDGKKGVDVYEIGDDVCDVVFTNPPYDRMTRDNMLDEFLRISKKKVILLLNIFYLSSKDRKKMLENSCLRHIYIHSDRVTMYPYGEEKPKNGGTKMFAWYVWDKEYKGKPTISWI
jgi:hypothetical protein